MNSSAKSLQASGYNERLFSGKTIRSWLHNSRFFWFRKALETTGLREFRVVEVGCFDGRLLEFFPTPPVRYEGLDADWEGGLTAAQEKFKGHAAWRFHRAAEPSALAEFADHSFNVGAALETLEHVPPHLVDGYLRELARVIDGYVLVTVPNEKGLVFLTKWLIKKFFLNSGVPYQFSELIAATLGRMHRVERNDHKGFDYAALVRQIGQHFDLVRIEGMPMPFLPVSLSFTIGILAKSKAPEKIIEMVRETPLQYPPELHKSYNLPKI